MNKQNTTKKAIITGTVVTLESLSLNLFLENMKIERQRTSLPYLTISKKILSKGVQGYIAGFFPWGLIMGFTKGSILGGSHSILLGACHKCGLNDVHTSIVAGYGAGAIQGAFMSPMIMARTRIMKDLTENTTFGCNSWARNLKFSATIINKTVRNEGFSAFFKGMPIYVAKRSIDWGNRFMIYDALNQTIDQKTVGTQLASSFATGVCSTCITMPIDRFIPIIQSSNGLGLASAVQHKIKTEGIKTLFKGMGIRCLSNGYHTMFATFVADYVYKRLNNIV